MLSPQEKLKILEDMGKIPRKWDWFYDDWKKYTKEIHSSTSTVRKEDK